MASVYHLWTIFFLSALLLLGTLAPSTSASKTIHFKWEVEYMFWSPDCVEGMVMAINGQFPGPTVRAKAGDTIVVDLHNKLHTEGVVIHWHGIRQLDTPWADGTASISQCAINPGDHFVYRFKVDKSSTYFYHGHLGMQRSAGLYGSLIVDVAKGQNDPFDTMGSSSYFLVTGGTRASMSRRLDSPLTPCVGSEIRSHKMVVVEADGNYVKQFLVDNIDIHSGDSYSVLLKIDNDRQTNTPHALSIINYKPNSDKMMPKLSPPVAPAWNDYALSMAFSKSIFARMGSPTPPKTFDRRIVLLNTQNHINGFTKWALNNVSLTLPATPYLGAINYKLKHVFDAVDPPDNYDRTYDVMNAPVNTNSKVGSGVYNIEYGKTVYVIFQNANALSPNVSEIHPWHLHGHDFWVLGYGDGKFGSNDEQRLNIKNPPLRNTAIILPCGWTALRFVADNPGVWAFHCHIEPHLHMGMGVIFAEAVDRVGDIPHSAMACGMTAKVLMCDANVTSRG